MGRGAGMNLKQLKAERESAGAEYVKAIETLRSAFVRLAAVERTLTHRNISDGEVRSFHPHRLRLEQALQSFQHWDFIPRIFVNEWHEPVVVLSDEQIAGYRPD
jgi:hypothetical protein